MAFKKGSIWDSNKTGHRFAASVVGLAIGATGLVVGRYFVVAVGLAVPVWERFCSPDQDHRSRKIRSLWSLYWSPFKYGVPHRSVLSHSLLIGTPLRFAYAIAPFVGLLALIRLDWLVQVIENPMVWWPVYGWIPVAAAISDLVHLVKDRYNPVEIIFGK